MKAQINQTYPNRIQLIQSNSGAANALGPLATASGLAFDPASDLEIYQAGTLATVGTSSFDVNGDQYLIFLRNSLDFSSVVQIIYRMPVSPFLGKLGTLPGYAIIAREVTGYDPISPVIGVSIPLAYNPAYVLSNGLNHGWNIGGFGTGGWGSGGVATFDMPPLSGWNIGGFGTGGWGSGGVETVSLAYYGLGVSWVRLTIPALNFDSGLLSTANLYGSLLLPALPSGQLILCSLEGYDADEQPTQYLGADLILPFDIKT